MMIYTIKPYIFWKLVTPITQWLTAQSPSTHTDQCPARVDIESSRSEKWNENLIHSFREVKSEMKIWFTLFEKWKVKWKFDSLFSRSEKWNENLVHSFREWKVKWKCLDIEIESEKWNENVSKSRSRVKSELKMPRDRDREVKFLENFREISRYSWESRNQENFQILLQILFISQTFTLEYNKMLLGMVLGWDM